MKLIMENFRNFKKKVLNEMIPDQTISPAPGGDTPPVSPSDQRRLRTMGEPAPKEFLESDRVVEYLTAYGFCVERDSMGNLSNCYIDEPDDQSSAYAVLCRGECKGVSGIQEEVPEQWIDYLIGNSDKAPDNLGEPRGPSTMGD